MVVGLALAAVQMGMALPTGFLFGVGYGTGVRIGYEQVYPLLFPKGARPTTTELAATMKGMNTVYDAIGGKDASRMGIAVGITNAGEILNNPDFRVLEQLESSSSGPTSSNSSRSRYGLDSPEFSPQQVLSSEIQSFNKLNNTELWARFRSFTIMQLNNIIQGSTDPEVIRIATIVQREKLSSGGGPSTSVIPPPTNIQNKFFDIKQKPTDKQEYTKWVAGFNYHVSRITLARSILRNNSSSTLAKKQAEIIYKSAMIAIRARSNQFRHANNLIRTQALLIRKQIAAGHYKR